MEARKAKKRQCEHCDKQISSSQIEHHIATCHATLLELLEE